MFLNWLHRISSRRKVRRLREIEQEYRDERSDRRLEELQNRKQVAEGILRDRQRRNHWEQAINELIQSGGTR